jgi:undecaprenyl-diphosphatase
VTGAGPRATKRAARAVPDPGAASAPSGPATLTPPAEPRRRGIRELIVGFVVALLGLLVYGFVALSFSSQELHALDTYASPSLHALSSPALDAVMTAITTLGTSPILLMVSAGAIVVLLARRRRARALFLATAVIGSVLLDGALKLIVHRARPVLPWAHVLPDYSFPSGHTMNGTVLYLGLALLAWVAWGPRTGVVAVLAALALSLAIGFSRVYLGFHYASDVIGGLGAGIAWLLVVALAFEVTPRTASRLPWMGARRSPE